MCFTQHNCCNSFCFVLCTEEGHGQVAAGIGKYEHGLSHLMHNDLRWLVIPQ